MKFKGNFEHVIYLQNNNNNSNNSDNYTQYQQ